MRKQLRCNNKRCFAGITAMKRQLTHCIVVLLMSCSVLQCHVARTKKSQAISPGDDFQVRNYSGKCLDFGKSPVGTSATVFLNNCGSAHSIRVTEVDNNHHVILEAGNQVLGIHNPITSTAGDPPPASATAYALELQNRANPTSAGFGQQSLAFVWTPLANKPYRFLYFKTRLRTSRRNALRSVSLSALKPFKPAISATVLA